MPPKPTEPPKVPGPAEKPVSLKKPDTKTPPKPTKKPATPPTKTAPDTTPPKPKTPKEPDAVPNSSPAPAQQLLEPGLVERGLPGGQQLRLGHVDLDADHVVAQLGHGRRVHRAQVTATDHGELHVSSSSQGVVW